MRATASGQRSLRRRSAAAARQQGAWRVSQHERGDWLTRRASAATRRLACVTRERGQHTVVDSNFPGVRLVIGRPLQHQLQHQLQQQLQQLTRPHTPSLHRVHDLASTDDGSSGHASLPCTAAAAERGSDYDHCNLYRRLNRHLFTIASVLLFLHGPGILSSEALGERDAAVQGAPSAATVCAQSTTTTTPRAHVRGDAHVHGPNNYNNLCHDAAALGLMAPSHGNNLTILWRLSGLCCGFLTNFLLTPTSATWVALSSSPPTS